MNCDSNMSIDDAWAMAQADPSIGDEYERQAAMYKWSAKFELSPHWAYWFARNVIEDHWPVAESFIQQDNKAWEAYSAYKNTCTQCGILNHSVNGNDDFHVTESGQITGWKEGKKPVKEEKQMMKEKELDDIADRIAEQVAVFKKRKKVAPTIDLSEDDDESYS